MAYRAAVSAAMAQRYGVEANLTPCIVCDGCGERHSVGSRTHHAAPWFLAGKPPRGWRGLSMADRSKRWDLCPSCWKGKEAPNG